MVNLEMLIKGTPDWHNVINNNFNEVNNGLGLHVEEFKWTDFNEAKETGIYHIPAVQDIVNAPEGVSGSRIAIIYTVSQADRTWTIQRLTPYQDASHTNYEERSESFFEDYWRDWNFYHKAAADLRSSKVEIGDEAEAGSSAVAIGGSAKALGQYAVALGDKAVASAQQATALGYYATAENMNEGMLGVLVSKWIVPGSLAVEGTKNFEIPHPKPEKRATHRIRHSSVESPTAGDTLYRYEVEASKSGDKITIELPDYFVHLNKDVQIFVTPQGHFGNGYGEFYTDEEKLEIYCELSGKYNVLVIGTRNDTHQSILDWNIKGVEREVGESWTGETYAFSVDEIIEIEEIKEVI